MKLLYNIDPATDAGGKVRRMNMRMARGIGLVVAGVGLLLLTGCGGSELQSDTASGDPNATLVPVQTPEVPIEDVPVPVGFKLDEGRSRYFAPGATRFVDYFFTGSMARAQAAAFYRQEMVYSGWKLDNERMSVGGDVILDFANGKEECVITLTKSSRLFKPTEIYIALWTAN